MTSDYLIFGHMKETLSGKNNSRDDEDETVVMKWFKKQSIEFD